MKSPGKTAYVSFLVICAFVFTSPLVAQSSLDEELLQVYGELLHDEEYLSSEEFFTGEVFIVDEEVIVDKEPFIDDDELFLNEEDLVFDAPTITIEASPVYENRSFDDIFPGFPRGLKPLAFSKEGLKHSFEKDDPPLLIPHPDSGIDLLGSVMEKNPSHIIEALFVVPYNERELDMLDLYNALGRIETIKDHTILVNGNSVNIFSETTRLESARNRNAIPDPPPADMLPFSETMYLRFRDTYMGNLFLRGDLSVSLYGITYSMTNFADIRYFVIPIMRAERFTAIIYLEPVKEGVLIYSMSGLYLPGFIADRVNLTSNINQRIAVLLSWVTDNLKRQERVD